MEGMGLPVLVIYFLGIQVLWVAGIRMGDGLLSLFNSIAEHLGVPIGGSASEVCLFGVLSFIGLGGWRCFTFSGLVLSSLCLTLGLCLY